MQFDEAMRCTTGAQAIEWLEKEKNYYAERFGADRKAAEEMILRNIGYMAGYYNHETAQKVYKLFGAVHPVTGTASYHLEMTLDDLLNIGAEFGYKMSHPTRQV